MNARIFPARRLWTTFRKTESSYGSFRFRSPALAVQPRVDQRILLPGRLRGKAGIGASGRPRRTGPIAGVRYHEEGAASAFNNDRRASIWT